MPLLVKLSNSLIAIYGAAAVALAAALMHLWQAQLNAEALGRIVAALSLLAFHTIALLAVPGHARLYRVVTALWHLGIWFFCYTLIAGVLQLPFYFAALAPLGGQSFILGWLVLAVALWRRN